MRSRKTQNPKLKPPQKGARPYRRLSFVDKMRQTVQRGGTRLSFSEHWHKRVVAATTEPPRGSEWERGWHTSCYRRHRLHSGGGPNVNSRSTVSKGVNLYRVIRG